MVRYLPILLGTCLAIVSGLIGAVGVRALAFHEKVSAAPVVMTFEEFTTDRPDDAYHYQLTNLRAGTNVYPDPVLPDGEWEKVYVCLFPRETRWLGKNYISIIAEIEGVKGVDELAEYLKDGKINAYHWPTKQDLPKQVYDRMAQKYRSMQFKKCVHVESGGPPPSPEFGNNCIQFGIYGVGLSVISVAVFYFVKLVGVLLFRKRDPWYDEEEEQISNKAGLPTA